MRRMYGYDKRGTRDGLGLVHNVGEISVLFHVKQLISGAL